VPVPDLYFLRELVAMVPTSLSWSISLRPVIVVYLGYRGSGPELFFNCCALAVANVQNEDNVQKHPAMVENG